MLYKFKSRTSAEVIMLQANGEHILKIVGKAGSPQGIITVEQIPAAIAALEAAVAEAEAAPQDRSDDELEAGQTRAGDDVSLRQRAAPFIALLKESHAGDASVVWGV